ncbi:hypothetical protein CDD83_190 [Cordyceps sp. RAO-2017]|nr:hypothetical protein CDD83_190 [Cordyceps sp. RAO-2017]
MRTAAESSELDRRGESREPTSTRASYRAEILRPALRRPSSSSPDSAQVAPASEPRPGSTKSRFDEMSMALVRVRISPFSAELPAWDEDKFHQRGGRKKGGNSAVVLYTLRAALRPHNLYTAPYTRHDTPAETT